MIVGKKTIFSFLIGLDLLTSILTLTSINFLYTTTIMAFCTSILLPGLLISLILRIRKLSFWENLLLIVGLSIAFLEFGGLLLNILLPLFGVKDPLSFQHIVYGFAAYTFLLFIVAWIRTKQLTMRILAPDTNAPAEKPASHAVPRGLTPVRLVAVNVDRRKHSRLEKVLYAFPVFFPLLAALGAIVLNNGGSNILTLMLLGAIAVCSLLLVLLRDKIASDLYPFTIFFIGVASLFTTSLRSWYITGHDITQEFYVFQLTNSHHLWNMAFYQDAYNACLSITILPTVLTYLLSIQDAYVYKIIFQILFATSPVIVFFLLKNYTTPVLAFLSALFFMSFPTFFNDMPMLNRQEIGFIFFGLVLYVMLLSKLSLSMRKILFIIFALSVIVSHYSTNFVLLALVAFVYISTFVISLPWTKNTFALLSSKSRLKNTFTNNAFLTLPLLLLLFAATYLWNTVYTGSSTHDASVLSKVINDVLLRSSTSKSSDISYSIFFAPATSPEQQFQTYIQSTIQAAESVNTGGVNNSQFYSKAITSEYPSHLLQQEQLAPTPLGDWLSSFHIPLFTVNSELRSLSASFMQFFVFVGMFAILFLKHKKPFDLQYLLLCFCAILLLILQTLIPSLSVEYGILRMFQQLLFMLSLPIVLGLDSILFFVKEQRRIVITAIITVFFFLNLTGFISHLTGDYYPQMTLDNAGIYYDAYYVHKSDVLAGIWISENNSNGEPVEAALTAKNPLLIYGSVASLIEMLPEVIRKNAYVYLNNPVYVIGVTSKDGLIFNAPTSFLDNNKNLIYSNGKDTVYK